jgi:anthranilate phosphoribosyltransferase
MTILPQALRLLVENQSLSFDKMQAVMRHIMLGEASPAQIGAVLVALRMKGETVAEIAAAAAVMREMATPLPIAVADLVDIVGTGGDGVSTFNISTASALVVAAAGGKVAKHGNRAVSSRSGSADVLEAAGVNINLTPEQTAACIQEVGIGFLFAPLHHGAMRHAAGPRRELGIRTVFNLLGPLTNPAGAERQLVGVYDARWLEPVAQVLGQLGSRHAFVVHADDGLDEISLGAPTRYVEWRAGQLSHGQITPESLGLTPVASLHFKVEDAAESLRIILPVLSGAPSAASDLVSLNAGAALYVAGLAADIPSGLAQARQLLSSGAAAHKLNHLIEFTQQYS